MGWSCRIFCPFGLEASAPCCFPCTHEVSCLTGAEVTLTTDRCSGAWQEYAERRALRAELKALQKEERHRQQRAIDEVLKVELAENSLDIQLLQLHLSAQQSGRGGCRSPVWAQLQLFLGRWHCTSVWWFMLLSSGLYEIHGHDKKAVHPQRNAYHALTNAFGWRCLAD